MAFSMIGVFYDDVFNFAVLYDDVLHYCVCYDDVFYDGVLHVAFFMWRS